MSGGGRLRLGLLLGLLGIAAAAPVRAVDCQREIDPIYLETDPASLLHVTTDAEVDALRAALVDLVWSGRGFPTALPWRVALDADPPPGVDPAALPSLARVDSYRVLVGGFGVWGHHLHPTSPNGRLVLLHQGHSETLDDLRVGDMLSLLLEQGFSVIAFFMPGFGPNSGSTDHGIFANHESASFDPLRVFVEAVAVSLNHVDQAYAYEDVSMVGLSGGGWTTTLYAALDPRVRLSFPVAGSLPLYLREGPCGFASDYEQTLPRLYEDLASYLDLYVLGSHGEGREQLQILNQFDGCCFWGITYQTYEDVVAQRVAAIGSGHYEVHLDRTRAGWHWITPAAQTVILRALGTPVWVIDQDDPEVTREGLWVRHLDAGYAQDRDESADNGKHRMRWTLSGLPPGLYRVAATWGGPSAAPDAPFELFRDGESLGAVTVDQTVAPADFVFQGTSWHTLADVPVPVGEIAVELFAADASAPVVADAVYVEHLGPLPYEGPQDPDGDGVPAEGNGSGIAGDSPCTGGEVLGCDDNCPDVANALQLDADADGVGDACDICLDAHDPLQVDSDADGFGNACDGDFDQSGIVSIWDFLRLRKAFGSSRGDVAYDAVVDMDGSGSIFVNDVLRFKVRFAGPPGPSALACAGSVPCP